MIVFWVLVTAAIVLMLLSNFDVRFGILGGAAGVLLGLWSVYRGFVPQPWMGFTLAGVGTTVAALSIMVAIMEMRVIARVERRRREARREGQAS